MPTKSTRSHRPDLDQGEKDEDPVEVMSNNSATTSNAAATTPPTAPSCPRSLVVSCL